MRNNRRRQNRALALIEQDKLELENKIKALEVKKLELECEKIQEETIAIKIKRRALLITLFFTGIGLFLQYKK